MVQTDIGSRSASPLSGEARAFLSALMEKSDSA
jgi:hypothetical protein